MDFQVVVLAGGSSNSLMPLVSHELPKALLPVANRPVLSYVLELVEGSCVKDLIVVVEGEENFVLVGNWISSAFVGRLHVEVSAVPEDIGTAGALRAVAHHLTLSDILVLSGDLVCDVPPGAVAATHRRHSAVVTALLCASPVSGIFERCSSGGKDKAKNLGRLNIIGLDSTKQFLMSLVTVEKDFHVMKTTLRASSQMEIRTDLMDAHFYVFNRSALLDVLDQYLHFSSLKQDVVPYLIRSQLSSTLRAGISYGRARQLNGWNEGVASGSSQAWYTSHQTGPSPCFHELYSTAPYSEIVVNRGMHKCCAHIANENKYCSRLNYVQAFSDINRDVIGDASHLSGHSFSSQNNFIHLSMELESKTNVGPNCILAEGSMLGDKCNVKRSSIGRHCRIGNNVKIINSVVMNHVSFEDGCSIQNSVICSNVHVQEHATLKDCQVVTAVMPVVQLATPSGSVLEVLDLQDNWL